GKIVVKKLHVGIRRPLRQQNASDNTSHHDSRKKPTLNNANLLPNHIYLLQKTHGLHNLLSKMMQKDPDPGITPKPCHSRYITQNTHGCHHNCVFIVSL
ncbi:MAG: hypothetical protein KAT00_05900, partial [Planctomycetes bacterium]|nr:hypothetical protein [Planctomycetota bacterium]